MLQVKTLRLIPCLAFFALSGFIEAQIVENHIGFRGGIHSGIYYQNMITAGTAEKAFHASLAANDNSLRLTILRLTYEMNLTEFTDKLFLVWGYGGHLGFSFSDHTYFLGHRYQFPHERFRPLLGIDAFGGLEYRFTGMPLVVGLNMKPFAEIMVPGFVRIQPGDIGLSVAYRF